jgi:hypothetical protein
LQLKPLLLQRQLNEAFGFIVRPDHVAVLRQFGDAGGEQARTLAADAGGGQRRDEADGQEQRR